MAVYSTVADTDLVNFPIGECGTVREYKKTFTLPSSGVSNADTVSLITLPDGLKVIDAWANVKATLGTSCTVQLMYGSTALATASTATAATISRMTGVPFDTDGSDILNLLVGGANITASADVDIHIIAQRK
jgi:hypothetical protein